MLLHHAPASQPQADANLVRIGVGIDTSRYGHYAAFLRDDLQPAAGELQFVESAAGYAQLRDPSEHKPIALNCCCAPGLIEGLSGLIVIDCKTGVCAGS
jgi:hypothetical protein